MGVLNVTPDSFSDGGRYLQTDHAIDVARQMIDQGADLIDVGGESTRPGALRVPADEQIRRVIPVIRALSDMNVAISVDTTQSRVASAALDAGACIINDISAGTDDPEIIRLTSRRGCPVILMHMQGTPETMQLNPTYQDVVREVKDYLIDRARTFETQGVDRRRIILDPGIGFGKTLLHNLLLLNHLSRLVETGYPVLIGTSRKGFIGKILNLPDPGQRLYGSLASVAWSVCQGVSVVRVHDVLPSRQTVTLIESIRHVDPSTDPNRDQHGEGCLG